ncbi:MAG TPA: putative sugar nucleotidyl transferase [Cytophagaceae bacterium]|jgi:UDP-N-acetylglucosamine diphosphorylase/glucosamine-1-phosphate N-acetyltransferase|nr:putative sugar nucleotidyl transferase [Cytophagaceae bacterium]
MNFTLFDESGLRDHLMPFTALRPIGHFRVGIFCIYEKWEMHLKGKASFQSATYLQSYISTQENEWCINASLLPDTALVEQILSLAVHEKLMAEDGTLLAYRDTPIGEEKLATGRIRKINRLWDIFSFNGEEIKYDFEWVCKTRKRALQTDAATVLYGKENIFIEEGAVVKAAVINAENGPVFIAKGAEVQEGTLIRGGFALCEGAITSMGSKFRGDCTVGPYSKVGGEVNNTVFFGYSNKGHDGYIGNSVVGEWCNLAAATNVSNMKNNHSEVNVYNLSTQTYEKTGKRFCGVFIGDYSRCGIGTTFNTGTVLGIGVNVFDTGFPPKYIPSYSWGSPQTLQPFRKAEWFEMVLQTRKLKHQPLSSEERSLLETVWDYYNLYHAN